MIITTFAEAESNLESETEPGT